MFLWSVIQFQRNTHFGTVEFIVAQLPNQGLTTFSTSAFPAEAGLTLIFFKFLDALNVLPCLNSSSGKFE